MALFPNRWYVPLYNTVNATSRNTHWTDFQSSSTARIVSASKRSASNRSVSSRRIERYTCTPYIHTDRSAEASSSDSSKHVSARRRHSLNLSCESVTDSGTARDTDVRQLPPVMPNVSLEELIAGCGGCRASCLSPLRLDAYTCSLTFRAQTKCHRVVWGGVSRALCGISCLVSYVTAMCHSHVKHVTWHVSCVSKGRGNPNPYTNKMLWGLCLWYGHGAVRQRSCAAL